MSVANPDTLQPRRPLSVSLIQERILSRAEVDEALVAEAKTGETLAEFVLRTHPAEEEKVGRLLAEEWGLAFVPAAELRVDPLAVERLPLALARDLEAIPIAFGGGMLVVAVAHPRRALFPRIFDELGKTWFVVVPSSALESLLSQPIAASSASDMPATAPAEPLGQSEGTPSTAYGVHDELRDAREQAARLDEELARLREVEGELHAAREELAAAQELRAELGTSREELVRLGTVEAELRAALEELTRLGGVEDELRAAREELTRLPEAESELQAARVELALLDSLQTELGTAREELRRVAEVEDELHALREKWSRLNNVRVDLGASHDELVRLGAVESELRSVREELLTRLREAQLGLDTPQ